MVGSLIPDIVKVGSLFDFLGMDVWDFVAPLHTPVGSMLSAALLSLLFEARKRIFYLLILGAGTHFALDFLLMHVSGGMLLLFPLSWHGWQLRVIQCDNYYVALIALFVACVIYVILKYYNKKELV